MHPSKLPAPRNAVREFRANGLPKVGGFSKGNRGSTYLGSCKAPQDRTRQFGEVYPFTDKVRPYVPGETSARDAAVVYGGKSAPVRPKQNEVTVRRAPNAPFVQGVDPCPGCGLVCPVARTCFCW